MELSGHPTQDLIEELVARGAVAVAGGREGPAPGTQGLLPDGEGGWLWLPDGVFDTGLDDTA